ncbi:CGNR zinc finger domain-containing protein [Streptomyces sp. NPDC001083]|uniref:CGNR zinc finger domain-containing protein n=1 Tax=Streptomyces sp. NPDC001083 TaxID=3364545 RepID=UPI0036A6F525
MPAAPAPEPQTEFPFIGGRPALNFVATLGKRHTEPLERLPDPESLARWITEAGLGTGADDGPVRIGEADLVRARALREAVHRLVHAALREGAPDPADVARVNEAAALPDLAPQFAEPHDGASGPALRWTAGRPGPAALATVARDAVLLISGPLLGRVKECENPTCSLLFLDDSQARRRRWCSMDRCGNLAKVAGYRARGRTASTR